jgi:hypothetical protein
MKQDGRSKDFALEGRGGCEAERTQRPAPGKVTLTSKLPGRRERGTQSEATSPEGSATDPPSHSSLDATMDPAMDAAQRGLAAQWHPSESLQSRAFDPIFRHDAGRNRAAQESRAKGPIEDWTLVAVRPDLHQKPILRKSIHEVGLADVSLPAPGSGNPMPREVQTKMENAFGTDFSMVRIHEGPHATTVGAQAFTQGNDIHFAPGQYDPVSEKGQELVGHELAHVVQQRQGKVRATGEVAGMALNDDPSLEQQANEQGARAARGEPVQGARVTEQTPLREEASKNLPGGSLQRKATRDNPGEDKGSQDADEDTGEHEGDQETGGEPDEHDSSWGTEEGTGEDETAGDVCEEPATDEATQDDIVGDEAAQDTETMGDGVAGGATAIAEVSQGEPVPGVDRAGDEEEVAQELASFSGQVDDAAPSSAVRAQNGPVIQRWGWLKKAWKKIKSGAKKLWKGVKSGAKKLWKGIKSGARKLWKGVKSGAVWLWGGVKTIAKAIGRYGWDLLKSGGSLIWTWITKTPGRILKLIKHLGRGVAGMLSWVWQGLKTAITNPGGLGKWFLNGLRSGAAWAGRLIAKGLDVLGAGEVFDFLAQLIKVNTRSLNSTEISEARKVFGSSLPYAQVRIDEASFIAKIIALFHDDDMGITISHTINFNRKIHCSPGSSDMAWLIHELVHVAQMEAAGLRYIGEALYAQATSGYHYGDPIALAGRSLSSFNREQQAEIAEDFYKKVLYGNTPAVHYLPLIDDLKAGRL